MASATKLLQEGDKDFAETLRLGLRTTTGNVSLLTTRDLEGRCHGLAVTTAVAFSTQWPAMIVAVSHSASAFSPIRDSTTFCLNQITSKDIDLLDRFGRSDLRASRFTSAEWRAGLFGLPDHEPRAEVLSHSEMRAMREARDEFLQIAEPEVKRLFLRLVDSEYLVSLASPQAAMLLFRCDYQYLGELASMGVLPGSIWDEEHQGTNGIGTCLQVGKSVTIICNQHYGPAAQSLTCLTAPVLGRSGAIESVINVTTARSGEARMNRVVRNIVERSARRIQNGYFIRLHRRNMLIRLVDNAENSDIAEAGRLALAEDGKISDGQPYRVGWAHLSVRTFRHYLLHSVSAQG